MSDSAIGNPTKRSEDYRFLKGKGQYTDDIVLPNQSYAYIIRSPYAHAEINGIDSSAAAAAEGVIAIYTAEDLVDVGGIPCSWLINNKNGEPMNEPKHPILAEGKARHVGDQVAVVIAETYAQAKRAAELVEVDYNELPAVINMKAAIADGATKIHEGGNLCYDWEIGDKAAVDEAFAKAHHITKLDLVNNRLIANAMEPRCAIGDYEETSGEYTLYTTTQNPHVIRLLMGAFVLGIPEHKLRIVAPDVGGGFGSKIFHYAEEALITWSARKLCRPVKWTAERSESFMSDAHGRDHVTHVELALDADGKFLALNCETSANMGAYLSTFSTCIPTILHATLLAGQYTTPAIYVNIKAIFTNTVPVDAYRGAGRPEAAYIIERIVDQAARETGIDPAELRRRNFIQPDQFPYQTPVALQYDTGDFDAHLTQGLAAADYDGFAERKAASAEKGLLRGIGLSCYIEACGIAPSNVAGALGCRAGLYEAATVRVHPTGSVTVFTGSHSHGQGHETTFAQLVSDRFGIDFGAVDIVHGDTAKVPFGMGTYGSRSLSVGGSAISIAMDKIIAKAIKIATHSLEAADGEVFFKDGAFQVEGSDKSMTFGEVALTAYIPHNYPLEELEPGLDETAFYDPKNFTYPSGTHICEVEIDPETGVVKLCSFHASDDFGNIVNPMIVEGQVHGGIAQGVGQALMENCVYDDNGQLLSGSYMDYCMPRADDLPFFTVDNTVTPCTHNPLGVKGCGEAGTIGSPPAVINAVIDALSKYGISSFDMPASPHRVWQAIQTASKAN